MALAALIVAVVAAVISFLAFAWSIAWSIWQHRQVTQGKLHAKAFFGFSRWEGSRGVVKVKATNHGLVPVTITRVTAVVKAGGEFVLDDWMIQKPAPLPQLLRPGEEWSGENEGMRTAQYVKAKARTRPPWKVAFRVHDAGDRVYRIPGTLKFDDTFQGKQVGAP